MATPLQLPAWVRCNRGFGWSFWLIMGVVALVTLVMVAANQDSVVVALLVGGSIGALFLLVRALLLPRLEMRLTERTLRTRRRTIPFSDVWLIKFTKHYRAGVWADFIDHDGKILTRMSVADSLFAAPTWDQWAALAQVIASTAHARGATLGHRPTAPGQPLSPGNAVEIVQEQAAWCLAGHRSNDRRAPAAALRRTSISLA